MKNSFPVLFLFCCLCASASVMFSGRGNIGGTMQWITTNTNAFDYGEYMVFSLSSDVHVGRANTFADGEPSTNYAKMISQGAQFHIVTGDIADNSGITQTVYAVTLTNFFTTYSNTPFYMTSGNHDACPECGDSAACDAGIVETCSESYSNFVFYYNGNDTNMHWVVDKGQRLRFIGFDSRLKREAPLANFGKIGDDEFTWLTNQIALSAAAGKKTILCSHFPLLNDFGNNIKIRQAELLAAMSNAGNVVAYFGGHRHGWGEHLTNAGTVHVNVPGLSYSLLAADSPYSGVGGYFMVTASNWFLNFQLYCANPPTYTLRPTNFSIAY